MVWKCNLYHFSARALQGLVAPNLRDAVLHAFFLILGRNVVVKSPFYTVSVFLESVGVDIRKKYPTFHAPRQNERIVELILEGDHLAIGKGHYGRRVKAPFHSHAGEEYVHILHGRGVFRTRTGRVVATEGMTLRFAPKEEHEFENRWKEPLEFIFVYSNPADVTPLKENWIRLE